MHAIPRFLIASLILSACTAPGSRLAPAPAADVFAAVRGSWSGVLEYADYRSNRRVQLPTRLTAVADGGMLTLDWVYTEPSGETVTSRAVHQVDVAAGRYVMESDTFRIEVLKGFALAGGGRMVLAGTVIDNDRPEPARYGFTLQGDTLRLLKETRSPWQFRNEYRLVRVAAP